MLDQVFYRPLRESSLTPSPLISKDDVTTIFSNLDTLISLNEVFLSELQERLQMWSPVQKMGDMFVRMVTDGRSL
jgi:hypothetical protein